MNLKRIAALGAVALAATVFAATPVLAQEGEEDPPVPTLISYEGPSSGTTIASGLSATGAVIGPDGALYVPIGGEATTEVAVPEDLQELAGTEIVYFGTTGSVARVDPETGDVTTFAEGLPVSSFEAGEPGSGPTDAVFVGQTLYVLVTGSVSVMGGAAADYPNGIYRLDDDSWTLVADISAFNDDNPVEFPDAAPGGNPFAIDVRGNEFLVSDGNYNRILQVASDGNISLLAQFDNVVPTGLATNESGPVLNTWFSAAPHITGDSYVASIAFPTGTTTPIEGSNVFAQLIDVEFGPGGQIFVLQFGDQQVDEAGPPPPGRLLRWNADSTFDVLVNGITLPTSVNFSGDTAFITSLTGDVLAVEGVSALTPIEEGPAPEPTVAPPAPVPTSTAPVGPITPPNTGTGDGAGAQSYAALVLLLALAGTAAVGAGALTARR